MDYETTVKVIEALARAGATRFKSADFEIEFSPKSEPAPAVTPAPVVEVPAGAQTSTQTAPEPGTAGAAPPVDIEIPHQVNQVRSLLRLSDYELAERLFPDFTQPTPTAAKEA